MIRLFLAVLLAFSALFGPHSAAAQNNTLYGLTYDGRLIKISKVNAQAIQIRPTLSSTYTGGLLGLVYWNGHFYSGYHANGVGMDNGHLVRFGFNGGDEIALGHFGVGTFGGLTTLPDHSSIAGTYTSVGGNPTLSGSINLANNSVTGLPGLIPGGFPGPLEQFGITFRDSGTVYILGKRQIGPTGYGPVLARHHFNGTQWVPSLWTEPVIPNNVSSLVFDHQTENRMFVGTGYRPTHYYTFVSTSRLYSFQDNGTSISNYQIGVIDGFPGLAGLTLGPPPPGTVSTTDVPIIRYLLN